MEAKWIVYALTVLLNVASGDIALPYDYDADRPETDEINRSLTWAEPDDDTVVAWKIYKAGSPQFLLAKYRTTVWREEGTRPGVHCSALDTCGLTSHVYVQAVKIGYDGDRPIVLLSEPAHILWRPF